MTHVSSETRHATSVLINGHAVLLAGPSGSGKSDLALRLIDRGAILISDDYTLVQRRGSTLWATTAPNIPGKLEVRGLGIVDAAYQAEAPLRLIFVLASEVQRFPFTEEQEAILGVALPVIPLSPFEASAPIKVEYAMKRELAT